jgi:hypothetical protein
VAVDDHDDTGAFGAGGHQVVVQVDSSMSSWCSSRSDVGGKLRVGEQLVQALISAGETRLAGRARLIVSHSLPLFLAVSRFHWSISGSARATTPS